MPSWGWTGRGCPSFPRSRADWSRPARDRTPDRDSQSEGVAGVGGGWGRRPWHFVEVSDHLTRPLGDAYGPACVPGLTAGLGP